MWGPDTYDDDEDNWSQYSFDNNEDYYRSSTRPVLSQGLKLIDNPITRVLAIDCEMVECEDDHRRFSAVASVSVVNSDCMPLLDTYVDPGYYVSDYRNRFSGIRPQNLVGAPPFSAVRDLLVQLVSGRVLVGHDLKQDLAVLGIQDETRFKIRDTRNCYLSHFEPGQRASLKRLALDVLNKRIQVYTHSSLEDAKTTMELYNVWLGTPRGQRIESNPFEILPSTTFNFDDFKDEYSYHTDYVSYFWETFDPINCSVWLCNYKHNDKLKTVSSSANYIDAILSRLGKAYLESFGVMAVFGSDYSNIIAGLWIWRGQDPMFDLDLDWQVDYNAFKWKRLDLSQERQRDQMEMFLELQDHSSRYRGKWLATYRTYL